MNNSGRNSAGPSFKLEFGVGLWGSFVGLLRIKNASFRSIIQDVIWQGWVSNWIFRSGFGVFCQIAENENLPNQSFRMKFGKAEFQIGFLGRLWGLTAHCKLTESSPRGGSRPALAGLTAQAGLSVARFLRLARMKMTMGQHEWIDRHVGVRPL